LSFNLFNKRIKKGENTVTTGNVSSSASSASTFTFLEVTFFDAVTVFDCFAFFLVVAVAAVAAVVDVVVANLVSFFADFFATCLVGRASSFSLSTSATTSFDVFSFSFSSSSA